MPMTWDIILEVILFGIALSMDAFSMSITQGLTMQNLNKKRSIFIAFIYGFFQGLFPLIGFFLIEGISYFVDSSIGLKAETILSTTVSWISAILLLIIGTKMLLEAIRSRKDSSLNSKDYVFTIKRVLLVGIAVSIDALATGVAFHHTDANGVSLSTTSTIWLHIIIIMVITFLFSILGVFAGNKVNKILKGKKEITGIIGGIILILLSIWVILSHYFL